MNISPPSFTDDKDTTGLKDWLERLYEFLKKPVFHLLKLYPRSAAPTTAEEGLMYYDSDDNNPLFYDGTAWRYFIGNTGIVAVANETNVIDNGDGTVTIGLVDPLIVGKGGTGAATHTANAVLRGNGTGAILSDSAVSWDGATFEVEKDQNDYTRIKVDNNTSDTLAVSLLQIAASAADFYIYVTSPGFTPTADLTADTVILSSADTASGGLRISQRGNLPIRFLTNDGVRLTISGSGTLTIAGDLDHDGSNVGFFGTAPVAQQAHIADADGTLADITTKFNTLLAALENLGLLASS